MWLGREVCTSPGMARGPYPKRPAGRARQMRSDFFQWAGPANKRWFFPEGRAGKWEVIFPTGWTGQQKKNVFSNGWAWLLKKGRQIIFRVSRGRQNKPADKRIRMYGIRWPQIDCVFQFSLQDYKQNSIDFFFYCYYWMRFPIFIHFALFVNLTSSYLLW